MAKKKSPAAASYFSHISDLFTAAERKLLDSSIGASLAKATHAQIDAAAAKARTLRDKWRDLSAAQGRVSKRGSGDRTGVPARSVEKATAFHECVERFETRLAELVGGFGGAIRKTTTARAKARDKTIAGRKARRTAIKPEAPAPRVKPIPAPAPIAKVAVPKSRPAKVARKAKPAPASKPAAVPAAPTAVAVPPVAAPRTVRTISKKTHIDRLGVSGRTGTQSVRLDQAKQRSALTDAKAGRLALKGADTRRAAHTMSRGKKNQARRDSRSR